jgi:hypothetical protein
MTWRVQEEAPRRGALPRPLLQPRRPRLFQHGLAALLILRWLRIIIDRRRPPALAIRLCSERERRDRRLHLPRVPRRKNAPVYYRSRRRSLLQINFPPRRARIRCRPLLDCRRSPATTSAREHGHRREAARSRRSPRPFFRRTSKRDRFGRPEHVDVPSPSACSRPGCGIPSEGQYGGCADISWPPHPRALPPSAVEPTHSRVRPRARASSAARTRELVWPGNSRALDRTLTAAHRRGRAARVRRRWRRAAVAQRRALCYVRTARPSLSSTAGPRIRSRRSTQAARPRGGCWARGKHASRTRAGAHAAGRPRDRRGRGQRGDGLERRLVVGERLSCDVLLCSVFMFAFGVTSANPLTVF